jgi:hypothetical protein
MLGLHGPHAAEVFFSVACLRPQASLIRSSYKQETGGDQAVVNFIAAELPETLHSVNMCVFCPRLVGGACAPVWGRSVSSCMLGQLNVIVARAF